MSFKKNNKIAFVTCNQFPNLTPDDRLVIEPLQKYHIEVIPTIWDAPTISWDSFDYVILRSPWDYSFRFEEFECWLKYLEKKRIPISNPYLALFGNTNKHYLQDFENKGIKIPPTVWFSKDQSVNLSQLLEIRQWDEAVVKPLISAGGHQAWRTSKKTAEFDQRRLNLELSKSDMMIQAFMEGILTKGEWSFVFFDKHFSHAVLKQPASEEFRVQARFGGGFMKKEPSLALIQWAKTIVDSITWPLLYARVDAVEQDNQLALMELELLEPALFLSSDHPAAAQRFAKAINAVIS